MTSGLCEDAGHSWALCARCFDQLTITLWKVFSAGLVLSLLETSGNFCLKRKHSTAWQAQEKHTNLVFYLCSDLNKCFFFGDKD